ncbi:MAG: nucleotidyltransferase family protein [Flavobacteriales bacterium]
MKYGLADKTITAIQGVFERYPHIEKAILYGSRAKGNFREGSDIDLTLVGAQLTVDELFRIDQELDDLMLPYMIDLSIKHQIKNEDLLEHIERVGCEFWSKMTFV